MDYENLAVHQTVSSPGRKRMLSYDVENKARLGNLTAIQLDEYDNNENSGLDAAAPLSVEVTAEVKRLKADGVLPSTTTIDYGNSHVVVSESRFREDDIFAVWDRECN
mgnify:CR=1 FL=1